MTLNEFRYSVICTSQFTDLGDESLCGGEFSEHSGEPLDFLAEDRLGGLGEETESEGQLAAGVSGVEGRGRVDHFGGGAGAG